MTSSPRSELKFPQGWWWLRSSRAYHHVDLYFWRPCSLHSS